MNSGLSVPNHSGLDHVAQGISQPGGGEGSQWHGAALSAAKTLPAAAQGSGPGMIPMEPTNSNGRKNTCGFHSSWKDREHYKANYYTASWTWTLRLAGNLSGVCSRYPTQISNAKAPFVSQPGHLQQQCENYSAIKVQLIPFLSQLPHCPVPNTK